MQAGGGAACAADTKVLFCSRMTATRLTASAPTISIKARSRAMNTSTLTNGDRFFWTPGTAAEFVYAKWVPGAWTTTLGGQAKRKVIGKENYLISTLGAWSNSLDAKSSVDII